MGCLERDLRSRGPDGRPVPLWDPVTGEIDHKAAEHWKAYDLRRVLEEHWAELGPKLKGKLHIWVGEADDYFLNNAVHRLDEFLSRAQPPYEGSITYGPGQGHCWMGISEARDDEADGPARGRGDQTADRDAPHPEMPTMLGFPHIGLALSWRRAVVARSSCSPCRQPARAAAAGGQLRRDQGRALPAARSADDGRAAERSRRRDLDPERRPELLRLFETDMYGKVPQPARADPADVPASARKTEGPGRHGHPPRGHDRCSPTSRTDPGWTS